MKKSKKKYNPSETIYQTDIGLRIVTMFSGIVMIAAIMGLLVTSVGKPVVNPAAELLFWWSFAVFISSIVARKILNFV